VRVLAAVNEDGKISSFNILKSYPQGMFDEYAIIILKNTHWKATASNHEKNPVLTTFQFSRTDYGSSNRGEAEKECALKGNGYNRTYGGRITDSWYL
jgi:hypothetical protein